MNRLWSPPANSRTNRLPDAPGGASDQPNRPFFSSLYNRKDDPPDHLEPRAAVDDRGVVEVARHRFQIAGRVANATQLAVPLQVDRSTKIWH